MRNEIRNELEEIAPVVAAVGNDNCYRVPENYFEFVANEIMSKIQLPSTQTPFTAPTPVYFEGLADSILKKIKSNGTIVEADNEVASELAALSPLVAGIEKVNTYSVPDDYFANFKVAIPAAAQPAKVIPMHQPVRWMRYAAAAVVVGVIAISSVFLFNADRTDTAGQISRIDYNRPLSSISDEAIANYIKESPAQLDMMPAAFDDSNLNAGSLVEQLLKNVSDSDIQDYLKENQQSGEKDIKGI
jgi:hypothetical protein